ncbi:MAG: hypothetical protein RL036_488 [Actinomycetota bacterium]|jgi:hypothetical protein
MPQTTKPNQSETRTRFRDITTTGQIPVPYVLSDVIEEQAPDDQEMRQVMAALEWSSVEATSREVLGWSGISSIQEFVDLRSVLFPGCPLKFFINWTAAYGLGPCQTSDHLESLVGKEYLEVMRVRLLSMFVGVGSRESDLALAYRGLEISPACEYIQLPSGQRYFHSRFERETPERRLWVEAIADVIGLSSRKRG